MGQPTNELDTCAAQRAVLARFLRGEASAEEGAVMRAHVRTCVECRGAYRSALSQAAVMGRALRESRHESVRQRRRKESRRRAWLGASTPKRRRRFGLQLVLLPAFLIVLLMRLTAGDVEARLTRLGGEVLADTGAFEGESAQLKRGAWAWTGADGHARLEGSGVELELGPSTRVMVTDAGDGRFHLGSGELIMDGSLTLSTQVAVVHIDGRSVAALRAGRLRIEVEEGEAELLQAGGALTLDEGQSAVADAVGMQRD